MFAQQWNQEGHSERYTSRPNCGPSQGRAFRVARSHNYCCSVLFILLSRNARHFRRLSTAAGPGSKNPVGDPGTTARRSRWSRMRATTAAASSPPRTWNAKLSMMGPSPMFTSIEYSLPSIVPHVGSEKSASGTTSHILAMISSRLPIEGGLKSLGISSIEVRPRGKSITKMSQLIVFPAFMMSARGAPVSNND